MKIVLKNLLKTTYEMQILHSVPKKVMQGMLKKGAIKWQIHPEHCVQPQPNGVPNMNFLQTATS